MIEYGEWENTPWYIRIMGYSAKRRLVTWRWNHIEEWWEYASVD